jgi:transposase-like protein
VLVELKAVELRYRAVIDVLDQMSVTEVAQRNGVTRQSVHSWLRRYARGGMAALADKSSKPESCPHQMSPVIEARIVALRTPTSDGDRGPSAPSWPKKVQRCR